VATQDTITPSVQIKNIASTAKEIILHLPKHAQNGSLNRRCSRSKVKKKTFHLSMHQFIKERLSKEKRKSFGDPILKKTFSSMKKCL